MKSEETKYGSEETMSQIDDLGSSVSTLSKIHKSVSDMVAKRYTHLTVVRNPKEETEQYLQFSKSVEKLRDDGKLYIDKERDTTWPSFTIKYPQKNVDGSYMVIKHWMEKHDLFN
jgi:hypothetical protein